MALRRLLLPFVLAALLALAAGCDGDAPQDIAVIELRVWQSVGDPGELHATPRLRGSDWDAIGTMALAMDRRSAAYAAAAVHHYSDLVVAGVGLRIWQRAVEPERIFVQACASTCPERFSSGVRWAWRPLGMIPLPLDDGSSPDGRYRYGDLTVAVPRSNPELLGERERLLALRDVLEGDGTELDWSVATPTASWEGVTLSGSPPRVTGLELSDRGLKGEIWGYLGDFAELTELRLDGNALTGRIPSKLVLLRGLTDLRLAGNDLQGCIPPPLLTVRDNDLDSLGLTECPAPVYGLPDRIARTGTYRFTLNRIYGTAYEGWRPLHLVLDVPAGRSIRFESFEPVLGADNHTPPTDNIFEADILGLALRDARDPETWLFLDEETGKELERSPYTGCVYDCGPIGSPAALVEQLMASVWVNTAVGDDGEWVWP